VNHFEKNIVLTTKVGVCRNMRNLIWFNNVDIDAFYPRCYDLNDPEDLSNFCQDFKLTKCEAILKIYMRLWKSKDPSLEEYKAKAEVALRVSEKRNKALDDVIEDSVFENLLVSDKEWEILGEDELNSDSLAVKKHQAWIGKIEKKYGKNGVVKKKKKKKTKGN
jgi:tubulin monoglycylase TTLL3/8